MLTGRPADGTPVDPEDSASAGQFRGFLAWLSAVGLGMIGLTLFGAARYADGRLVAAAVATAAGVVNVLVAMGLVRRGRLQAAIKFVWAGLLIVGTALALCLPDIAIIPVTSAVLGSLIALPYVGGLRLGRVFILSFVWSAAVLGVRGLIPLDRALPNSFIRDLRVWAALAAVGLILLVLWHFQSRLARLFSKTREAETMYRTLVEQLPAVTFVDEITGPGQADIRPLYVSPKIETMLGYPVEEWLHDPEMWIKLLHPNDREWVIAACVEADAEGGPFGAVYRAVTKDGRTVWIQEESVQITDEEGEPRYWQGVLFDVTSRKQAEEDLRMSFELLKATDAERRRLLSELVSAQEEERSRIASEIHDDPVQKITAVGLRLEMLRGSLTNPRQLEIVDQLQRTVELSIAHLRRLMFDLRPPSLDRGGLSAAIGEFIAQRDGELGQCRLEDRLAVEPSDETRTVAYRIVVEALTNARNHSNANSVEVLLAEREGGLFLRVRDDGVGMPQDVVQNGRPGHLGLTSLRERAELVGGWSRIESRPGEGTTVEAWLPMEPISSR